MIGYEWIVQRELISVRVEDISEHLKPSMLVMLVNLMGMSLQLY